NAVEILYMNPVLEAKAGQLHPYQIGDRNNRETVTILDWLRKSGRRFEHQMNGAMRLRRFAVNEHVHTRRMAISKAKRTSGFNNGIEVFAIDSHIDVTRQPGCYWFDLVNVHIGGES